MTASDSSAELAAAVVTQLGGRYSSELGIDVDGSDRQIERWFVAATLFGTRISAQIAERTYEELVRGGVRRITDAGRLSWDDLVALLDKGGYARYDFRTATRLQALAATITERYRGKVAEIGRRNDDPSDLESALDGLPGWGPVTVGLFLRELRGVWPGAQPSLDPRAMDAGRHLGLLTADTKGALARLAHVAELAGLDERDLESGLVRLALAHRRMADCPGRRACVVLAETKGAERTTRASRDPTTGATRRP